jgi:2-hydroxy-4-carboxymuconate semialdehyde hemiacetal dehydrogenase
MKVIVAGVGAFGTKHLDAIKNIPGVEVVSVVGRQQEPTEEVARKYNVPHATTDLAESLARPGVQAAILCTPTQMHAAQALQCMDAGKHVQVEIPLADTWKDSEAVAAKAAATGLTCMVGHTRRFNPSHQWVHKRIAARKERHSKVGFPPSTIRRKRWWWMARRISLFRPAKSCGTIRQRTSMISRRAIESPANTRGQRRTSWKY